MSQLLCLLCLALVGMCLILHYYDSMQYHIVYDKDTIRIAISLIHLRQFAPSLPQRSVMLT